MVKDRCEVCRTAGALDHGLGRGRMGCKGSNLWCSAVVQLERLLNSLDQANVGNLQPGGEGGLKIHLSIK